MTRPFACGMRASESSNRGLANAAGRSMRDAGRGSPKGRSQHGSTDGQVARCQKDSSKSSQLRGKPEQ